MANSNGTTHNIPFECTIKRGNFCLDVTRLRLINEGYLSIVPSLIVLTAPHDMLFFAIVKNDLRNRIPKFSTGQLFDTGFSLWCYGNSTLLGCQCVNEIDLISKHDKLYDFLVSKRAIYDRQR